MQLKMFSFCLLILNKKDYSHLQDGRRRRKKRKYYYTNILKQGCIKCTKKNGCSFKEKKIFFKLDREGSREYQQCLHTLPSITYGLKRPNKNSCAREKTEKCNSCLYKDFCKKKKIGRFTYIGECFKESPDGYKSMDEKMERGQGCYVGSWSKWNTCTRNSK
uniref:R-spondin Fu-CRD domain-containing protein n=1 Tax=Sus scrofa TaxID=9823 RepID=A0A8D1F1D6_PIG